jgi:hypothetical protein
MTTPTTVPCTIDLEATEEHFHAHVELEGVEVEPGDAVLVRGAPSRIPLGEKRILRATATVYPASGWRRAWVRFIGFVQFHELYDVGFEG